MKRIISSIISALSLAVLLMLQGCEPPVPASISVSPASVTIPQNGGSATVDVNASLDWSLSNSTAWLRTDAVGGTGSQALVLTADANNTYEQRTATINFVCGDKNASLTVTQPGQTPRVEVDVDMLTAQPKGSSFKVKATSPTGAVTLDEKPDWIVLDKEAEGTFSFTAQSNFTGADRTGNLVFGSAGAESATVSVQQKGIAPIFEITPSSIDIGKNGGSVIIVVKANMEYHTEGVADWITEKSSRTVTTNMYEHIYSIAKNTTGASRTGVISFCNETGVCIPLVVNQSDEEYDTSAFSKEFLHKSLFMRFTATWCGYCPNMAKAIALAKEQLPGKIEQICFHGSGSALEFSRTTTLMKQYKTEGYPTGVVDGRYLVENYAASTVASKIVDAVKETESTYPVVTGVAMSSSLSGGTVSVQGKVYVKAAGKYKITALILEDDLDREQADNYEGYHASYIHNDVARVTLSNIKGDDFTIEKKNSVYEFVYSSAVSSGYKADNLRVIVYIQREFGDQPVEATGDYGGYYVDNVATAKVGSNLELQFAE
ncbi:MAG: Omp28-related outer membrane protein [Bacteroidales bacterium]|nr:Omp28-related outer membrane protein [Bacteroidales bacterium]